MKYSINLLFLFLLFACNSQKNITKTVDKTQSELEADVNLENSVLWKIEHETLPAPSYIYGTIHILCKTDSLVPTKVLNAIQEVDELILEIDLADPNELASLQSLLTQVTPISEQISEEEFNKLDAQIKEIIGIPLNVVDQMGFIGLTSLIASKSLDCNEQAYLEVELIKLANKFNKNIEGLETAEEQFDILNKSLNIEDQLETIYEFEKGKAALQEAVSLYLNEEDIDEAVDVLFDNEAVDLNFEEDLLVNRNNNWIEVIPTSISENSALIAVGTAHLVKEHGIINQLRTLGYTVTPVY